MITGSVATVLNGAKVNPVTGRAKRFGWRLFYSFFAIRKPLATARSSETS